MAEATVHHVRRCGNVFCAVETYHAATAPLSLAACPACQLLGVIVEPRILPVPDSLTEGEGGRGGRRR